MSEFMEESVFRINHRFTVDVNQNQVSDRLNRRTIRLEPRLMELLVLLTDRAGQVVPREQIITRVWQDYPGGSEGLNQAISFLRKVLDDESKQLIQTVPKKGYCLRAVISRSARRRSAKGVLVGLMLVGILLLGWGGYWVITRPRLRAVAGVDAPPAQAPASVGVIQARPRPLHGQPSQAGALLVNRSLERHQADVARAQRDSAHQAQMLAQARLDNTDSAKAARALRSQQGRAQAFRDSLHQAQTEQQNRLYNTDSAREERARQGRERARRDSAHQAQMQQRSKPPKDKEETLN